MNKKPTIFEYTDYRRFLQDWLHWKQTTGPYSKRWISRQAGFGAPNAWQLITQGTRNLSHKSMLRVGAALTLSEGEKRYFEDLVQFTQAKTGQERLHLFERLTKHPGRKRQRPVERAHLAVFQHWLGPVLYEMVTLKGFSADPEWIGEQLQHQASPAEIRRVFDGLVTSGLLRRDTKGNWGQAEAQLDPGDGSADLPFRAYHEHALAKAGDALDSVPEANRYFTVLTSAVPAEAFEGLREIAVRFENEVLEFVAKQKREKTQVIQVGFQLFPLVRTSANQPMGKKRKP